MEFTSKTTNDAWRFLKEVSENTLKWSLLVLMISNPPPQLPLTGVVCIKLPPILSDVKLISVARRFEALELSKGAQSSAPKPSKLVVSPVCVLCDSQDHLVDQCPRLSIIKAE